MIVAMTGNSKNSKRATEGLGFITNAHPCCDAEAVDLRNGKRVTNEYSQSGVAAQFDRTFDPHHIQVVFRLRSQEDTALSVTFFKKLKFT